MNEKANMLYIESMSGGDVDFEKELIAIIKREYPKETKIYFENFNSKNYKLAADNVHKLKHKISILGLEKSYVMAGAYENNLLEGKITLSDDFETVLNTMADFLKELN